MSNRSPTRAVDACSQVTLALFVPSRDGISHAPEEFTSAEELAAGAAVLATARRALAW